MKLKEASRKLQLKIRRVWVPKVFRLLKRDADRSQELLITADLVSRSLKMRTLIEKVNLNLQENLWTGNYPKLKSTQRIQRRKHHSSDQIPEKETSFIMKTERKNTEQDKVATT